MVIKGTACGGPARLAVHLQRTDTNERMEIRELHGVAAEDLMGALREMDAVASGTRCKRPFYHASINTRADEAMTAEQWETAIDRLEDKLGLTDQPRAIVAHVKEGRAHVHVVWSRIDLEHMRAIPDSHNYRKHEEVARELEREFGHARVQGAHAERDGEERPERTPSHAEMQQAERSGIDPNAIKAELTELWHSTDGGKAFVAAVEEHGYILALGDRRTFCIVDHAGDVHSLARRLDGVKTKEVAARLADIDRDRLPSVDGARETQRGRYSDSQGFDRDAAEHAWSNRKGATSAPAPEPARAPEPTRPDHRHKEAEKRALWQEEARRQSARQERARDSVTATPAHSPEPTRADDRRKKAKEPTRRKEQARPRSERERKESARDSVTATPTYEVNPAHAPEPTRPDQRHKQAEEQARWQEEARRQSEHLAQISASATAIYSAKPLRPEDRQRQAQEQARQQQEEARRRSEREREEHARDRVTATPTPAAQPVPAAQAQPNEQVRQAQEQSRQQEEAQRQSARQREEMARSRAEATPRPAPESPRIEPPRVAEPRQNAPQFDPVAAQRAKEAADQKAWSAKRDAELARVTKEKEARPVKAGLRVANVAGGVGLGLVDFVSNFLTGGTRPPAATDQVGKMKERNRAVAALERIADSVARGEDLSPADVRNLTPENLHNIRLKGDDYMKWIIEGIERDREREKDGGRYRER